MSLRLFLERSRDEGQRESRRDVFHGRGSVPTWNRDQLQLASLSPSCTLSASCAEVSPKYISREKAQRDRPSNRVDLSPDVYHRPLSSCLSSLASFLLSPSLCLRLLPRLSSFASLSPHADPPGACVSSASLSLSSPQTSSLSFTRLAFS